MRSGWIVWMCAMWLGLGSVLGQPAIHFAQPMYRFDTLTEGQTLVHRFAYAFLPRGTPVQLSWVSSSCDCAQPRWPHQRSDTGSIVVEYGTRGKIGLVERSFTVYDSLRQPIARLRLVGYIKPNLEPKPDPEKERTFTWRQTFGYNQFEVDTASATFKRFLGRVALTRPRRIRFTIVSSASQVPTREFTSNQALAESRLRQATATLTARMIEAGIPPGKLVWARKALVQGPPYTPGPDANHRYDPYQFVDIEAYLEE